MNYEEFIKQFERLLQRKADQYPNASTYLRLVYLHKLSSALQLILEQLEQLEQQITQPDTFWTNLDEIISDILWSGEISFDELFDLDVPLLGQDEGDFNLIKEKLYETAFYPISEHLNYIAFEPALERIRFIRKQLARLGENETHFCDLGFGPGVLMSSILQEKPSWKGWGVDISLQCTRYAQRLLERKSLTYRSRLLVADVRYLPYCSNSFDLVIGVEIFEHVPNPEEGLREAMRVLRPGGYAITALPVHMPLPMHLYVFETPKEVLDLYKKVGMNMLDFEVKEFNLRQGKFIDTFALSIKE